jgi:Spy/CpxP family protein refolding chaperone
MRPGPGRDRLADLGLSEEQRAKIRQQNSDWARTAERSRSDLRIKQMELRDLMGAANPDRAAIEKKMREIADLRFAREKAQLDRRFAFESVLTPEQKTKLREFRGPGFGPGPGPRPGRRPQL